MLSPTHVTRPEELQRGRDKRWKQPKFLNHHWKKAASPTWDYYMGKR
jgi:hypothetical protein